MAQMTYELNPDGMMIKGLLEVNDIIDIASLDIRMKYPNPLVTNFGYNINVDQAKEVLLRITTDPVMALSLNYDRIHEIIIEVVEGL